MEHKMTFEEYLDFLEGYWELFGPMPLVSENEFGDGDFFFL
jgi:hypothetical protein